MIEKRTRALPLVAIVGRANAGKSTLWNTLTETSRALVSPIPHTTRDRNYGIATWRGQAIEVVDTGGLDAEQGSEIGRGIIAQARRAIREADLVLFLVDVNEGVLPQDRAFANDVRAINPRILLVANKVDTLAKMAYASTEEMFALRLGEAVSVSASTGRNVGDLLDRVYEELAKLNKPPADATTESGLRIVVMGRPNVGKSSLVNAILKDERVIVSAIPHTTREPQDTTFDWNGERITLVDTAGMRKRSKIERGLEDQGLERNREALMQADIALLVFDATEDPTTQDRHLAGLLEGAGKGLLLVANKWDLVEGKTTMTATDFEERLRSSFPFLSWAPLVFISALTKQRTEKLLDLALRIREERKRTIAYNALQRFLKQSVAKQKPLPYLGVKPPYVHDLTQIGIDPPTFIVTVRGETTAIHASWLRYLENRLREKFGFDGTPIVIRSRAISVPKQAIKKPADGKKVKHPWARKRPPIGRRPGRY